MNQRKCIAQRAAYLVLPGFASLLRRARPVAAPAPLRGTVGLVAADRRTGLHLCVPLSTHLWLLCFVNRWEVTDFWHPGILERESLTGKHVTHLWEHRGTDAGPTGDQTIGSRPRAAALVGHRQRHRLGNRIPSQQTVSDKYLLA